MSQAIEIDYYTDLLCVWAWIAQRRIDELDRDYGKQVKLNHLYLPLFSDTVTRMDTQWGHRGSYQGFADHIKDAIEPYDFAPVNDKVWREVRPTTSAAAHLILKAAQLAYDAETSAKLALRLRQAFFVEAVDISQKGLNMELAQDMGIDAQALQVHFDDGTALAALLADHAKSQGQNVKGSPSWVMNEGRQVIYGNVGYRVLHANVEELLRNPENEASWC